VFRAREWGFKQFKCPVRNVLITKSYLTSRQMVAPGHSAATIWDNRLSRNICKLLSSVSLSHSVLLDRVNEITALWNCVWTHRSFMRDPDSDMLCVALDLPSLCVPCTLFSLNIASDQTSLCSMCSIFSMCFTWCTGSMYFMFYTFPIYWSELPSLCILYVLASVYVVRKLLSLYPLSSLCVIRYLSSLYALCT
jgi:hypothetical protein